MGRFGLGLMAVDSYFKEGDERVKRQREEARFGMEEKRFGLEQERAAREAERFGLDKAQAERVAKEHDLRMEDLAIQRADALKARALIAKGQQGYEAILQGTPEGDALFDEEIGKYNQNTGAYNDGITVSNMQPLPGGGRAFVLNGPNGEKKQMQLTRQQMADLYAKGIEAQLRFINPQRFDAYMAAARSDAKTREELDNKRTELGLKEREIEAMENYRRDMAVNNRVSSRASAGLHNVQRDAAQFALDQAKLVVSAREKIAAGLEPTPAEKAALENAGAKPEIKANVQPDGSVIFTDRERVWKVPRDQIKTHSLSLDQARAATDWKQVRGGQPVIKFEDLK